MPVLIPTGSGNLLFIWFSVCSKFIVNVN